MDKNLQKLSEDPSRLFSATVSVPAFQAINDH